MVRLVSREDFPPSWQQGADSVPTVSPSGRAARRSHDARDYDKRVLMRLEQASLTKLEQLTAHFQTSKAEGYAPVSGADGP